MDPHDESSCFEAVAGRDPVGGGARLLAVLAAVLLAGWVGGPNDGAAQQTALPGFTGGIEAVYQNFSFDDEEEVGIRSVSLLTLPFAGRIGLAPGVRMELRGNVARGELIRPDESSIEISGLTDTELRMVADLMDGAASITAFALIPTGNSTLSVEEMGLAGVVGADLLPFRVSNWGSGGGFGAAVTLLHTVGEYGFGMSGGYTAAREFEPLADEPIQYRPGNQLHLRAAVDRTFNGASKGTLQVSWQRYDDDAVDGVNLFRSGDRIQGTVSYAFPAGATSNAVVYAGYLHRAEGQFLLDPETRSSEGLVLLGGGLRTAMLGGVLVPTADLRLLRRDDGVDQGVLGGVGATLELGAGDVTLLPSARVRLGNVTVAEGVESGVRGIELGFGVRMP